jgi:3-oxoacyl-[acyl-carrier-protein] synthase-3
MPRFAQIAGVGSYLPETVLTNADLERMVDTTDEWITARTGIKERRIVGEGDTTSTLATRAAKQALAQADVRPEQLDMILVATVTPDYPFPSTACLVQNNLGARNAVAFDLSAACSGFLYGLAVAERFIRCGSARRVLVIGAEVLSRIVDWNDRNTCVLFGDGAGAAVVEAHEGEGGILSTHIHSDGSYWEMLHQPGPGSRNPAVQRTLDEGLVYIRMQGNEVFKLAVRAMEQAALEALAANGLQPADIDFFIPHQANKRIIDAIGRRLNLREDQVFVNLDQYGNTSAASIPLALDQANRAGRIKKGDVVLFAAFGGGLTWGAVLIRW